MDAIVIAAPTEAHHQLAFEALDAGLPLLVEKPLADTLDHAREIVERAEAAGLPLLCGLLERFNPAVRTAMDFVEQPIYAVATRALALRRRASAPGWPPTCSSTTSTP